MLTKLMLSSEYVSKRRYECLELLSIALEKSILIEGSHVHYRTKWIMTRRA